MLDRNLVLETDRVRLEPLGATHLPDLRKNANDPVLWEFTYQSNPFGTDEGTESWLREALESDCIPFAIVDTESGETIGSTRYADISPEHRRLEIGWTFVASRFWRTHVNTHCKFALFEYAFEPWNAARVFLKGNEQNARSRAAMARIGAKYEGTLRNFRIHPLTGEPNSVSYYSIIASEWPSVRATFQSKLARPSG